MSQSYAIHLLYFPETKVQIYTMFNSKVKKETNSHIYINQRINSDINNSLK